MTELSGQISDRLRKLFSPTDKGWTYRSPSQIKKMPKKGVQGVSLGGKSGRRKTS